MAGGRAMEMLTADVSNLASGEARELYVIELDMWRDTVPTCGASEVCRLKGRDTRTALASSATGRWYNRRVTIGDHEVWTNEGYSGYFMALFVGEDEMRNGGRSLARHWGDVLPGRIRRTLEGIAGGRDDDARDAVRR